ncbi:MAG: hypothetical protein VX640_05935 [Pseudomonadota bacterium]|nr:hypothetical protein [Pseudomonadota bacterium]
MQTKPNGRLFTSPQNTEPVQTSQFESFFKIWLMLERQGELTEEAAEESEGAIPAQTNLMELVASVESKSMEDLAYKLALWRWDAPDIDATGTCMSRGDLVAYSAFRDLVKLTGLELLMRPEDIETGFYRDQML